MKETLDELLQRTKPTEEELDAWVKESVDGVDGWADYHLNEDILKVIKEKKGVNYWATYYEAKEKKEREDNFDERKPIIFKRINFKYNFTVGSAESIEFHKILENMTHPRINIFNTEALKNLIKYKWKIVKNFWNIQALFYFAFVALISYHTSFAT